MPFSEWVTDPALRRYMRPLSWGGPDEEPLAFLDLIDVAQIIPYHIAKPIDDDFRLSSWGYVEFQTTTLEPLPGAANLSSQYYVSSLCPPWRWWMPVGLDDVYPSSTRGSIVRARCIPTRI